MNAPAQFRAGDVWGLPVMKFTLTYDGELSSTGNGSKKRRQKWAIRKHMHPQLQELWKLHPALIFAADNPYYPRDAGAQLIQVHHMSRGPLITQAVPGGINEMIDMCEPISVGGRQFRPLVRNSYALNCGLKILFMRREARGRVYQGGDLDNRIKTLLDALAVPVNADLVVADPDLEDPIYCLVEDDSLVTGLTVETERLLARPGETENEVRLIIEVDVRVTDARIYNQSFLGG